MYHQNDITKTTSVQPMSFWWYVSFWWYWLFCDDVFLVIYVVLITKAFFTSQNNRYHQNDIGSTDVVLVIKIVLRCKVVSEGAFVIKTRCITKTTMEAFVIKTRCITKTTMVSPKRPWSFWWYHGRFGDTSCFNHKSFHGRFGDTSCFNHKSSFRDNFTSQNNLYHQNDIGWTDVVLVISIVLRCKKSLCD